MALIYNQHTVQTPDHRLEKDFKQTAEDLVNTQQQSCSTTLLGILGYDPGAHTAPGAIVKAQPSRSIAQVQGRHINERLERKVDNA